MEYPCLKELEGSKLLGFHAGYVDLSNILALDQFAAATAEVIDEIVEADQKTRFQVMTEGGAVWIRANQGHSIATAQ